MRWYQEHDVRTPILVAEHGPETVAWGDLSPFKTSCTFHETVENSVYVHKDFHRQGVGHTLLQELIKRALEEGFNSMIAVISSDQHPSLELHRKLGFQQVGYFHRVGYKFTRWLDAVYLQLDLRNDSR